MAAVSGHKSFLQSHNSIGSVVSDKKIFKIFSQSEHVIGPGSHVEFPISTKNTNLVEDHPMNIQNRSDNSQADWTYCR
jgi:hypothetical protein